MKKFGTAKPPRTVIYQRERGTRRLYRREAITNEVAQVWLRRGAYLARMAT